MKIVARLIALAGLFMLGACNSPNASSAPVDARAAGTPTPKAGPAKIVGYSNRSEAAPGYGEGLGDAGGGGHHH